MGYAAKLGARTIAGSSSVLEFTLGGMGGAQVGNQGFVSFDKEFIYNLVDDGYNLYMKKGSYASSQYALRALANETAAHAASNYYAILGWNNATYYTNYRSNIIDYFSNHDESRFLYITFVGYCTANNNGSSSTAWVKFTKE